MTTNLNVAMAPKDSTFQVRINSEIKKTVEDIYAKTGMTLTDAFNTFIGDDTRLGRELLSNEEVDRIAKIRSVSAYNVLNWTLQEYELSEWYLCLEEKVLLEIVVPLFSEVLKQYPAIGLLKENEVNKLLNE